MAETLCSACPVVRAGPMKLWQLVTVGGNLQMLPFEQEIWWLRESEATVSLRHRGVMVKELCTLCDRYGYLTSVEAAITDDAPKFAAQYELRPEDTLRVEVCVVVEDRPHLPPTGRQDVADFFDWYTADKPVNPGTRCHEYPRYPRLEAVKVGELKHVYTTADGTGAVPTAVAKWIKAQRAEAESLRRPDAGDR